MLTKENRFKDGLTINTVILIEVVTCSSPVSISKFECLTVKPSCNDLKASSWRRSKEV